MWHLPKSMGVSSNSSSLGSSITACSSVSSISEGTYSLPSSASTVFLKKKSTYIKIFQYQNKKFTYQVQHYQ